MSVDDPNLLSRIEDASLSASAPPQQRVLDGWLLRFSPGKAKRARCVNAIAAGRLPLGEKLALCEQAYEQAGLPLIVRVTPFSEPARLDDALQSLGLQRLDDTRVMLLPSLEALVAPAAELALTAVSAAEYALAIGALRGSTTAQSDSHAERLRHSPVPYFGFVVRRRGDTLACGQLAIEADMVGLYDVFTAPAERGRGLAAALCRQLLLRARGQGARCAYLQVDADNHAARSVYQRLGFADAYAYHYRTRDPDAA